MADQRASHASDGIRRSGDDRIIAGVAAGVGDYLGASPRLVRAAFVFVSLFGGLGVMLYVAAWLLVPEEGEGEAVAEQWIHGNAGNQRWVGIGLLVLVVIGLADGGMDGVFMALAMGLLIFGVLLYRGVFDPDSGDVPAAARGSSEPTPPDNDDHGSFDADAVAFAAPPQERSPGDISPQEVASDGVLPEDAQDGSPRSRRAAVGAVYDGSPPEPPARTSPRRRPASRLGLLTAGLALLGASLYAVSAEALGFGAAEPADVLAVALVIVGAGLLIGTFFGRSRGLVLFGLVLSALVAFASSLDMSITGGVGDLTFAPSSPADLQAEYQLGIGDLVVDLSEIAIPEGEVRETSVSLVVGEVTLVVPEHVSFEVTVDIRGGELTVSIPDIVGDGETAFYSGLDVGESIERTLSGAGTLVIDVDAGFGQVNLVSEG